uniref:Serpentine receptor class gamma n=1 Tax=Strongyloides venezuelensis TaxID=75913 RepID=A0A0K0G5T0_STRVS
MIGLGNIFFHPGYGNYELFNYFMPLFKSKTEIYYQLLYRIFLFGIISIATCTFNVLAISTLKKHNQNSTNNNIKKEQYYVIYSIFLFKTLSIVQAYFIDRFIAEKYEIKSFYLTSYFFYIVGFDLTSVGDFYFIIYSSNELRKALKTTFGCSKKFNNKITIKITYRKTTVSGMLSGSFELSLKQYSIIFPVII